MGEKRKRKVKAKGNRRRQRVRRVWSADEWLSKVDWGRFGPQTPKRQAWEIIRRLANRLEEESLGGRPAGSWAERVGDRPRPRVGSGGYLEQTMELMRASGVTRVSCPKK